MNATARATLDSTPIPHEGGTPVRAKVTTIGSDWTLAWEMDGGRRVEPFGQLFAQVRDACAAARRLNERSGLA